jgi:hypothetical protein
MSVVTRGPLRLADAESRHDLGTYVRRAKRLDPGGAARLSAHGRVLAVYVSPLHGVGLPDVLGLRTFALDESWEGAGGGGPAALTDRLARGDDPALPLPPAPASGVSWAGISPPRSGWSRVATVPSAVLARAARDGVAEVAAGVPDVAGAPAVARLRAVVWGRPLPLSGPGGTAPTLDVPAGAALAADGLGFLDEADVAVLATGPWLRLSGRRGHVIVRRPLLR